MTLVGHRGEPLASGPGQLNLEADGNFDFEFEARDWDQAELDKADNLRARYPYEGIFRFRLTAKTAAGLDIHCGYAELGREVSGLEIGPLFRGRVEGISFDAEPLGEVGTEVLFLVPRSHWLRTTLALSFVCVQIEENGEHQMGLLGSTLGLEYDDADRSLSVSVTRSDAFPQTLTEWRLSEPLRLMLGQLAFPRITVRSNPDRAIVMISQTRGWSDDSDLLALFDPMNAVDNPSRFFEFYSDLLSFIVSDTGDGHDRNPLTRFYEEITQSMRGTRWVMTLTIASAIEGLIGMIFPGGRRDERLKQEELDHLNSHIDSWRGHPEHSSSESVAALKDRAKGSINYFGMMTATKHLKNLENERSISTAERKAWETVRNRVMHGTIFSPFSSEENDALIINLISLFKKLAMKLALAES